MDMCKGARPNSLLFLGAGQLRGRGGPGRIGLRRGMRHRGGATGRGAILSGRGAAGRGAAGPRGEALLRKGVTNRLGQLS